MLLNQIEILITKNRYLKLKTKSKKLKYKNNIGIECAREYVIYSTNKDK